jgi:hypothetical protein
MDRRKFMYRITAIRAGASYPASNVAIRYDEHLTNEKTHKEFLSTCGFRVA